MQRSFRLLRLGLGATACAMSLHAGAFTLGGPDCSIAAGSGIWCWGGSVLSGFRGALGNAANFGAGGTVPQAVSTVDLNAANFAATLPTLDGFIVPWWTAADAAPYSAAVTNYFLSGGNLLILADNSGNDPINAALGMPTRFTGAFPASATRDTSGTAPLYSGPFGTATAVAQWGAFGELRPADVILSGGSIVGTDATGRIVAAVWDEGEFAPGAGRLVVATDVDMLGVGNYTALDDNARFSLNAVSWLAEGGPVVAEPTPYYVLGGPDCSLAPQSSVWCWGGGANAGVRRALEEPLNFGPNGTVARRILPIDITDFSAAGIANVDGIVVPWWEDGDANAYAPVVQAALLGGKDVFLLQDDPAHDRVGEQLGIATGIPSCFGPQPMPTTGSGPLYQGAFGTAALVNQGGLYGSLDPGVIVALGGTADGQNDCGETTGAYWMDGAFGPGSGRLIVVTDVDMFSGAGFATYATPTNDNGRFALNAFDLLTAPAPQSVPEPGTLPLLFTAAGMLLYGRARLRGALV